MTPPGDPGAGSVLHVGCGGDSLPPWLAHFSETRLDIDPQHSPDIVASMTDMGSIGPFSVVYCSHALEHLAPHEVPVALAEFRRVMAPGGHAIIFVPDLEGVAPTEDVLFESPAGPIAGVDLYYGFRPKLAEMPHMAHRTGFVAATLTAALERAGFRSVATLRLPHFNLMARAEAP